MKKLKYIKGRMYSLPGKSDSPRTQRTCRWHVPRSKAVQGELSLTRGHQLKGPEVSRWPSLLPCWRNSSHTALLAAGRWFHVLPACSTLWYCACVQLAPLPRRCLNTFPSHTLLGVMRVRSSSCSTREPGRGSQSPLLPPEGCVLPPLGIGREAAQSFLPQQCLPCHLHRNQDGKNTF